MKSCSTNQEQDKGAEANNTSKLSPDEINEIKQDLISIGFLGHNLSIGSILGRDLNNTQEIYLSRIDTSSEASYTHYGNHVIFELDNTFSSNYSAPCGNDCFPYSSGTYRIIDKHKISLFLKTTGQNGMCQEEHNIINKELGTYKIIPVNNQDIKLLKE